MKAKQPKQLCLDIDWTTVEIDGVDPKDYPDFCDTYFSAGQYMDGRELTDDELDKLTDENGDTLQEMAHESFH